MKNETNLRASTPPRETSCSDKLYRDIAHGSHPLSQHEMDSNAVSVESIASFSIARKPSPKQAKVLAMLREKPEITLQEVVAEIGTDIYANAYKHVGVTLSNMVKRGMLRRVRNGVFGLPNDGTEQQRPG